MNKYVSKIYLFMFNSFPLKNHKI